MPDPRFHTRAGPFALSALAEFASATLQPDADPGIVIEDVAPLDAAGPRDLSFLDNPRYLDVFLASAAGACIVAPRYAERAPREMALLLSPQPYKSYAQIARAFYPVPALDAAIAPSAVIDPTARLGEGCLIDASAVIAAEVEIGRLCRIGANAVIGRAVKIGDDSVIGACAVLSHCIIGDRVSIYRGVCIGQDGFGFAPDPSGHVAVPQLGRVIIGDDAQVGANSTIDRGSGPDTVIGAGCWIDNLVQIGHNVRLGRGVVIVAQVGIAGSTAFGDHVMAGGQSAFSGHLQIGAGAQIAAQSGVIHNIPAGERWGGSPAGPAREWHRRTIALRRLAQTKASDDD